MTAFIHPVKWRDSGFMSQLEGKLREGLELLESHGHECDVSPADFCLWFRADTPYPDISMDEVLQNPLLVVHELVEIDEVKRLGLALTKDAIISNLELVDKAHLKAAEVEMKIATAMKETAHLADRLRDIRAWSQDSLTEPDMRKRYEHLAEEVSRALAQLNGKDEKE